MNILPENTILPPRTIVREGAVNDLLKECGAFGSKGMLVHGGSLEISGVLGKILGNSSVGLEVSTWRHPGGEPTLDDLSNLVSVLREKDVDWVAGVGGGSVMDVAKAAAGLRDASLSMEAYHDGAQPEASKVPFIAAPTTAGTGSEATTVSVLINSRKGEKKSIRHPSHMASLVILDAGLLKSCPPRVVAVSGLDAFVQAVESHLSNKATWFSRQLSLKATELIAAALPDVFEDNESVRRADLMTGSYLAGVALANARLGLVHGLAHPLGIRYNQPHGLVCGVCFGPVMDFNRGICGARIEELTRAAGSDPARLVADWLGAMGVESPFAGKSLKDADGIVSETLASGSTAANPRPVKDRDVLAALKTIFGN